MKNRWQHIIEERLLAEAEARDWAHMPDDIFWRLLRNIAAGGVAPKYQNGRGYQDGRV